MVAALLVLVMMQGEPPALTATVDQDRVPVGATIVYTIVAVSRSFEPMEVTVPPVAGLQIVSRIERNESSSVDHPTRTTVLELHLRAVRPGRWRLGPVRARQGGHTVEANVLTVQIDPDRSAAVTVLSSRIRRLLERAPPPPYGRPAVSLVLSDARVRVGEEVDVLTAAWFPRDLRVQLENPPTLQTPVIDGVWTAPQTSPAAVAGTRNIGGMIYDLFVAHQVVFPLVPGTVTIPPATLKYATPAPLRFLSGEERYAMLSRSATLIVDPLPAAGRPAAFSGAIASRLRLQRRIASPTTRVGQAMTIDYTLSGEGNTALWPAPEIHWPPRMRAYTERVEENVTTNDGRLGGSKVFRYLVVPDSVGVLRVPAARYSYFDLAANRYLETAVEPATLAVTGADEVAATAALPPSLLPPAPPAWSWRVAHDIPAWVWWLLLVLPPLAIVFRTRLLPRLVGRRRPPPVPVSDSLGAAEARLEAAIVALVPTPAGRTSQAIETALRAAGINTATAAHVMAVRERMLATRYAPRGRESDDRLIAEVDDVAQRLVRSPARWRHEIAVSILLPILSLTSLLTFLVVPGRAAAQAPSPEKLYETGALSAAVEGFRSRTVSDPAVAAHWYGLGAAYYRLGLKGRAEAAWLHARQLDPRSSTIRRALQLTPPADPVSARWIWVPPVRPEELLLVGICGWCIAWFGWVSRPRVRDRWIILLVFSGGAVLAGLGLRQWYRRPVAIALDGAELRLSPHGRASALGRLDSGGAVFVLRERPGWMLVRTPDRREGWLPADAVAPIGG